MKPSICPKCGHKKYRMLGAWVCYLCDYERYLFLWHLMDNRWRDHSISSRTAAK